MSNTYTQFSQMVEELTDEEHLWLKEEFEGPGEEVFDSWTDEQKATWLLERSMDDYDDWSNCDYGFETMHEKLHLWLYSDEGSNLEVVAYVVHHFLKKFRPNDSFSLEWAVWCDKMSVDGFAGGALFITADKIEWFHTGRWLEEQHTKWKGGPDGVVHKEADASPAVPQ